MNDKTLSNISDSFKDDHVSITSNGCGDIFVENINKKFDSKLSSDDLKRVSDLLNK